MNDKNPVAVYWPPPSLKSSAAICLYCYVKRGGSALLLIPAALSLAAFVGLLMLHPAASGRVYAAYGGVYILTALLWLRFIDGIKLSPQDWLGAAVILCDVIIMISGWRNGAG